MQEKESIMVVLCELKIPSLEITVRHHSASLVMPNGCLVTEFSIRTLQLIICQIIAKLNGSTHTSLSILEQRDIGILLIFSSYFKLCPPPPPPPFRVGRHIVFGWVVCQSVCPSVRPSFCLSIKKSCPLCNLKTVQGVFMKPHTNVNQH